MNPSLAIAPVGRRDTQLFCCIVTPNDARCNRQLRAEALPIFFAKHTFEIDAETDFMLIDDLPCADLINVAIHRAKFWTNKGFDLQL